MKSATAKGVLLIAVALFVGLATGSASAYVLERVSVATDGTQANGKSFHTAISGEGRYVVFDSDATNLVADDTNGKRDIFLHDRQTGQTARVNVASDGTQADNSSQEPASVSADGRYVAFSSTAANLVAGDSNGRTDIFRHDCQTGQTIRVSVDTSGAQANQASINPATSADGRFVAFQSSATNLVPGDTNARTDLFVRDCQDWVTTRVSVSSDGIQANGGSGLASLSGDGRYVVFTSDATNLVPGHSGTHWDIFLHDRLAGQTTLVSAGLAGNPADADTLLAHLSADGRYVVFETFAANLVSGDTNATEDIFLHDRLSQQISRVNVSDNGTQANGMSGNACLSADGRYVAFGSDATNLVPYDLNGTADVFVRDLQTGRNTRVSLTADGVQGNAASGYETLMSISADAQYVGFGSDATNLISSDSNGVKDIYVASTALPPNAPVVSTSLPAGWSMISLPLQPLDADPAVVFLGLPITDNLWRYDGALLSYVGYWDIDPSEFGPMQVGEGYWLCLQQPATISYRGYAAYPGPIPVQLPLAGWHMIGQPREGDVLLSVCTVTNLTDGLTEPYSEASQTQSWLDSVLYGWYPSEVRYWEVGLDGPPINDDNTLRAWKGYWLKTSTPNLVLNVPAL